MIHVATLKTTQDGFRLSLSDRISLGNYVAAGRQFEDPVALERFPDGEIYVRDGLHRVVAICVERTPPLLHEEEYWTKDVTYEDFMRLDLTDDWLTPFDPRTEIRLPEFWRFKRDVQRLIRDGGDVEDFVNKRRDQYCRKRELSDTIEHLAARWLLD